MKMKNITLGMIALGAITISMTSCEKDKTNTETKVVATDSVKMPFQSANYTFYSLENGKVVPLSDSATTNWDIGIRFTDIIVNSHASGPGQGGVITETSGNYETFSTAPTTGYSFDTTTTKLVINGKYNDPGAWYLYNPVNHGFSPKAGWFFVIKTADGKYAKLEVTAVDYADYPQGSMYPNTLIYRFRYTYQADGSVNLTN